MFKKKKEKRKKKSNPEFERAETSEIPILRVEGGID